MKWRPVSEKPEEFGPVLMVIEVWENPTKKGESYLEICKGDYGRHSYNRKKICFEATHSCVFQYPSNYWEGEYEVTHWMPLPQLPQ